MDFKLEKMTATDPRDKNKKIDDPNLEKRMEEIFKLIYESGQVRTPTSPIKFMQWWNDGIIRIFTARDLGELKAIRVYMIFPDALELSKKHIVESLSHGEAEGFDEYVNNVLEIFK